jgi:DNA-binding GntR family transcriptional regulator
MSDDQPEGKPYCLAIYEQLRRDILSCRLPPGAQIYEQDLGRRFGVSKSPVREALVRLREQNLVEVKPRSGYRVRPVSLSEVIEMYEIRVVYETACVELAIEHCDEEAVRRMAELADVAAETAAEWIALNQQFHACLARASGNRRLAEITTNFITQFERFTQVSLTRMPRPQSFDALIADHKAIVEAIVQRDKRAGLKAVRRHIEASQRRTVEALNNPMMVAS